MTAVAGGARGVFEWRVSYSEDLELWSCLSSCLKLISSLPLSPYPLVRCLTFQATKAKSAQQERLIDKAREVSHKHSRMGVIPVPT